MKQEDLGVIHDEGFLSLTYNKEFDLWVLIVHYDLGSFNETETNLFKNYNEAYAIYKKIYNHLKYSGREFKNDN